MRPKLGDTGLDIHPRDQRSAQYIDRTLRIHSVLGEIDVEVVADQAVESPAPE